MGRPISSDCSPVRCRVYYRFQRTDRAKPKVVHVDRLKPYLGPPLQSWLPSQKSKEPPMTPQAKTANSSNGQSNQLPTQTTSEKQKPKAKQGEEPKGRKGR